MKRLSMLLLVPTMLLALPGVTNAQTKVFDSCDVRFPSGTYVVASNHDGADATEAVIASLCADMIRQGANGIAKGTPPYGAHQVCTGSPWDGAVIAVASTYADWETGTALCNSASSMSPARTVAESQAADGELEASRAQLDAAYYAVTVSRVVNNAYRDQATGIIIVTSLCLHLALGDDAVLQYEPGAFDNRLFFSDGGDCMVSGIYPTNATLQRVNQDVYLDTRSGYYLQTQFCYVYAYGEDALVLPDQVIFIGSRQTCQVSL